MYALDRYLMIFFLIVSSPAFAQELKSIDSFINSNKNNKGKSVEIFVGLRCASLYMVLSGIMEINNTESSSKKFKDLSLSALNFAISNGAKDDDYVKSQTEIMTKSYIDKIKQSQALTGNMFDNPIIVADSDTCRSIFIN